MSLLWQNDFESQQPSRGPGRGQGEETYQNRSGRRPLDCKFAANRWRVFTSGRIGQNATFCETELTVQQD